MLDRFLASNVAWSMLNHLLSRGSMMLAAILLARHFNTREFASYNYFQLTASMLATYAAMGLGTAAAKFFAEHVHQSADPKNPSVIGILWIGSLILSCVAAVIVLVLPKDWLAPGVDLPKWLLAAGVLIMSLQAIPNGAMQGLEEFKSAAKIAVGTSIAMLGGTLVAVALDSITFAMAVLVLATMVQVVGVLTVVLRRTGPAAFATGFPIRWVRIRAILDVSIPLAANGMIVAAGVWILGRIILSGPGGDHAFALYSIGMQWFALAMFLPGNMGSVFLPRMVKQAIAQADSRPFVRKAIAATLAASVSVAAVGVVIGPIALRMYGDQYGAETWVIAAYLGAAVAAAPIILLGNALLAHGAHWKRLGLMMMWAVVLIAGAYVVRSSVVYGGAIAMGIAYGSLAVAMLIVAKRMEIA